MVSEKFAFDPEVEAPAEYREFWSLWAAHEYFDCHEVLEVLWRRTSDEHRLFYQGLIHCAVALHHAECSNATGAFRQWVRADAKLRRYAPLYEGVDVDALLLFVKHEVEMLHGVLTPQQRADLHKLRRQVINSLENHE